MYLRVLEMTGFKSFAHKTKLEFEPGMTSVVGPNGCGKSNVSDAIRWVLGEQSAKALRGSKMEDCIFNGTDDAKAMSMAEVSVTFADCERTLQSEYDEMTITRRVFRSGEGHYFINKTPCRLKDIQRLFMDTGIGTTSYSFMQQGRIDRVLSDRPEDRRTIFEEASGITKFKADKHEAILKLNHTEANLLRLADVIREVKRQIGSLQRQAGKARRYKAFESELRQLDIFATRRRLQMVDDEMDTIESEIADLDAKLKAAHAEVDELENGSSVLRKSLVQTEREIGNVRETNVQAQSRLDHTHELIATNEQRIEEYRVFSTRDSKEVDDTRKALEHARKVLADVTAERDALQAQQEEAGRALETAAEELAKHQQRTEDTRSRIRELREETVGLEGAASRLQNQLVEIDSRQRSSVIRKERLAAEKAQLGRVSASYKRRQEEMDHVLADMGKNVAKRRHEVEEAEARKTDNDLKIADIQRRQAQLSSDCADRKARVELLRDSDATNEGFPEGAGLLLDKDNPLDVDASTVVGTLTAHLDIDGDYRQAAESVLHNWLDVVLVTNAEAAGQIVGKLAEARKGGARLLPVEAPAGTDQAPSGENRLIDHIRCPDQAMPVLRRLIGNVIVVDSLDAVPSPVEPGTVYVTRDGSVVRGDGSAEFWMADTSATNPLARTHLLADNENALTSIEEEIAALKTQTGKLNAAREALDEALTDARNRLDAGKTALAQKEGEAQVVASEATEADDRLETVSWELQDLMNQGETGDSDRKTINEELQRTRDRREQINSDVAKYTSELHDLEKRAGDLQTTATDRRVNAAALKQQAEHLAHRHGSQSTRVKELENTLEGRSSGIESYRAGISRLTGEIDRAREHLAVLEQEVAANQAKIESLEKNREKQSSELQKMEQALATRRETQERLRNKRSELEVRHAENKMRRENQVDRVTTEYNITVDQIANEPEPEWDDDGMPSLDTIETRVAELQTKLEAMGPVNLVAIDEYKELEERYTFLTTQEEDLKKAKQQLMDMIRKINRTTSEMFRSTFDQVNENFQAMFKKLFNGGSAKLVLVNEEDVLECGIEIIARPPGKRLQNVSLLSGGERTLAAVSLLFAIYMIKPSPFCLLDELDAALDDSNIGRFVRVLKDFLQHSQFLVITHNRQTIAAADTLYGVTMPGKGISKVVSVKFNENETAETNEPIMVPVQK